MSVVAPSLTGVSVVRVIHFADLHLGVEAGGRTNPASGLNQRIHDVCDRLDELCAVAEAESVDLVVFAGDAFKHQHPTPTLQSLFAARMRRLARNGTRVFLLIGNHDLPRMAALSHPFSIYGALEVEGVVVGDRADVYRLALGPRAPVPEIQVAALPHFSRHQALARMPDDVDDPDEAIAGILEETVRRLGAEVDPGLPCLFTGHCHVQQAQMGAGQSLFGVSDVEVSLSTLTAEQPFPYYALGHVHSHQVLARDPYVAYAGSLERVDFGEGERMRVDAGGRVERKAPEEKGFVRLDLAPGAGRSWELAAVPEFRSVRARPFITLDLGRLGADPAAEIGERIGRARELGAGLTDAFVKITVEIDAADRGRLPHRMVRELVPEAYEVRIAATTSETQTQVRDPRFASRMGEAEALERYLETKEDWADEREELLRLGRALIAEVTA